MPIIPLGLLQQVATHSLDYPVIAEAVCCALMTDDSNSALDVSLTVTLPSAMLEAAREAWKAVEEYVDPPRGSDAAEGWKSSVAHQARFVCNEMLAPTVLILTALADELWPKAPAEVTGHPHGAFTPEEHDRLGTEGRYLVALAEVLNLASMSGDGAFALAVANLHGMTDDRQFFDETLAELRRVNPLLVGRVDGHGPATDQEHVDEVTGRLSTAYREFCEAGGDCSYGAYSRRATFPRMPTEVAR